MMYGGMPRGGIMDLFGEGGGFAGGNGGAGMGNGRGGFGPPGGGCGVGGSKRQERAGVDLRDRMGMGMGIGVLWSRTRCMRHKAYTHASLLWR